MGTSCHSPTPYKFLIYSISSIEHLIINTGIPCFVCSNTTFSIAIEGGPITPYRLIRCEECGMVIADSETTIEADYSDYGSYLDGSDGEINAQIARIARLNQRTFGRILQKFGVKARILDFGGGACYFGKAAENAGFEAWVAEPSKRLRDLAENRVGFRNVRPDIGEIEGSFDVICMFDVIEHLPPEISRELLEKLLSRLKSGGLFVGNTPNFHSANILLCGDRDPAIGPPHHLCYFSPKSLNRYLSTFGLQKQHLSTRGFSSNSFFRPNKTTKSFVEQPLNALNLPRKVLSVGIRVLFRAVNEVVSPLGLGYQIFYEFEKGSKGGKGDNIR